MELNLKNKTCLVTGGNSGLGAAICEIFAAEGANVVINYLFNPEDAAALAVKLTEQYGIKAVAARGNITSAGDIDKNIRQAVEQTGRLDILVNCAGVWPTHFVKDMSDEDWENTVKINLTGPFMFAKRVVNHFIDNKVKGKIINIVSQAAFHGSTSGHAHYAAAKGGLVTFTISLAREVAKYGINVTAVAPGMMRTPMNKKELAEREDEYIKRIPLGRISDPKEVACTVAFLASDKADYITGATIDVTGGMLMR
jgi:3-oxoacyl-[acyl-carrier protein] reductase